MAKSITYKLHDTYGNQVGEVRLPTENHEAVIIDYEGKYYRPLFYNMVNHTAECIQVKKITVARGSNEDIGGKRESAFPKEVSTGGQSKID